MIAPPTLAVVTQQQEDRIREYLSKIKFHRKEEWSVGWSNLLGAFTIGEEWFYFIESSEASVLVPLYGSPYTVSEEAFYAYLESSDYH